MSAIHFDRKKDRIRIGDSWFSKHDPEVRVDLVKDVTAEKLREVLIEAWGDSREDESFIVEVPVAPELRLLHAFTFDVQSGGDWETCGNYYMITGSGDLILELELICAQQVEPARVISALTPLAEFHHCHLTHVEKSRASDTVACVSLKPNPTLTLGVLSRMTASFRVLLADENLAKKHSVGIVSLLARSSDGQALLGASEKGNFDAKRIPYHLSDAVSVHKYCIDLASMANNVDGGVIALGLATERDRNGRDIVHEIVGIDGESMNLQTYRQVADQYIFPPIEGLEFHVLKLTHGVIVAIHVPPQPESLRPFLVRRTHIEPSKLTTTAFTLPIRRGFDNAYSSIEYIHSLLVAGRVSLSQIDSENSVHVR